jgi:hypothetical protein
MCLMVAIWRKRQDEAIYRRRVGIGRALINDIKKNNYDVNVLWKGNIAHLWVLENNFSSMIANDFNFSLP